MFYSLFSSFFLSILLSTFLSILLSKFCSILIKKISQNVKLCINSLIIDLKVSIDDQHEHINLKIETQSIEFDYYAKNIDDFVGFALKIENIEFVLKKQESNTIFANIFLPNFEINRKEKTKFSIQINDEIQIYYPLLNTKNIFKALFKMINFPFNENCKHNDLNLEIAIPTMNFYFFRNESILINANVTNPTSIKYSLNNGNHDIQSEFKFKIRAFYRDFNLSNEFGINFHIENANKQSYSINGFKFDMQKGENKKTLIKMILPKLTIGRNENQKYEIQSNENISIYYSLFYSSLIIDLMVEIKDLIMNDENKTDDQSIVSYLLNFTIYLYLNIQSINLFLTKSNLPLLLLEAKSIKLLYPIENQEKIMQATFELKHLCFQSYNVINHFSLVISYFQSNLNISISPIQTVIASFLIHEILSPEINDELHSELDNHCDKIYIKNETGSDFQIFLTPKIANEQERYIDVTINSHKHISKQKYEPEIKVYIGFKYYIFSIHDLYSPIFLDENIVVSRKSLNGINSISFSSPYVIHNKLSYSIEVRINEKICYEIESNKKVFIPISANFSLSKKIEASIHPVTNYSILNFKGTYPIIFYDVNSKPLYYSTYYLSFNHIYSLCSIIFEPYIKITNYLPFNLTLTIKGNAVLQLEPNKPKDISFLNNDKGKEFSFTFDFKDFAVGNKVIKRKIEKFEEEVCLSNNEHKVIAKIVFKCSKHAIAQKETFTMAIYAPLVLKNELPDDINLLFKESNECTYQFINKVIFYNFTSLLDKNCLFRLPIYCDILAKNNFIEFELVGNFSKVIKLNLLNYENIYLFISSKNYNGCYNDSLEVRIRPYLTVINQTNHTVNFVTTDKKTKNGYKNSCQYGKSIIIGSNDDAIFDIYIDDYQHCVGFNFFSLGPSVIRFVKKNNPNEYILLRFTVKNDDDLNCYQCIISKPESPTHIYIKNKIPNIDIFVYQHFTDKIEDFEYHPMVIHSNEELIYAKEQPFIENEIKSSYYIFVSFGNNDKQTLIKFDEDCQSMKISDTQYYYSVKRKDFDYLEIVFDKSNELNNFFNDRINSENISQIKYIKYTITFTEFELSYVDKEKHELFLFDITKASLKIDERIIFSIKGFTLNDMHSASISPVVIHGKENPFLFLEIDSKYPINKRIFDNITLKLSPIRIYADLIFIIDLYASIMEIIGLSSKVQNSKKSQNNFLFKIFSTNSISIDKISFELYPNILQNRKYRFKHPDYYNILCKKISFFKEIKYTFNEKIKYNVEASIKSFLNSLFEEYKNQITIKEVLSLLTNNFLQSKQTKSNSFEDFLKYKSSQSRNDDYIMQYPRRIPRAFPKGQISNVPIIFNDLSIEYPDVYSDVQYKIQKNTNECINERLHEIFESVDNRKLAIYDNFIFIIPKPNSKTKIVTIEYKEIGEVKFDSNKVIFTGKKEVFQCKSEQDAKEIVKKVNSFITKMKLFVQTV